MPNPNNRKTVNSIPLPAIIARMGMYLEISRRTLVQLVMGVVPVIFRVKYEITAVKNNPIGMTLTRLYKTELLVCENW